MDLSGLEGTFVAISIGLASLTQTPELAIDPAEAHAVAVAVANVAKHYPSIAGSQKMVDWSMLVITLGAVGGKRMFAIAARKQAQQQRGPTHRVGVPVPPSPPERSSNGAGTHSSDAEQVLAEGFVVGQA